MLNHLCGLQGKVALVTGGGRGIGEMVAQTLVKLGAKVYIASRKLAACEQTAQRLSEFGQCIALQANLATEVGVMGLADEIKQRESQLHILVNNSGKTWGAELEQFPWGAWKGVMDVNLVAPFTLTQQLLPLLQATGSTDYPARVINVGSIVGSASRCDNAYSYAASKSALHHLTKVLALELAGKLVNINAIAPGYFPTQMMAHVANDEQHNAAFIDGIPAKRAGCEDDIAGIISFLAGRGSNYVTGAIIPIDGGLSVK
ncbi:MAG: SDR family oxidoreductase [Algicola sp.]|nr:SDR family oxidoreductase [Algicola sp.]